MRNILSLILSIAVYGGLIALMYRLMKKGKLRPGEGRLLIVLLAVLLADNFLGRLPLDPHGIVRDIVVITTIAAFLAALITGFVILLRRSAKESRLMIVFFVVGALILLFGFAFLTAANDDLNDGEFLVNNYGNSRYAEAVQVHDASPYVIAGGGVLMFVALIYLAVRRAVRGRDSSPHPTGTASPAVSFTPAPPAGGVCPGCGAPLKPGQRFCGSCGRDLTQTASRFCAVCGQALGPTDSFCPGCGTKFGG